MELWHVEKIFPEFKGNKGRDTRRFLKYTYEAVRDYGRVNRNGLERHRGNRFVNVTQIFSHIRGRFEDRRMRQDPPYLDHYTRVDLTREVVNALSLLETKGVIEFCEENGSYRALR